MAITVKTAAIPSPAPAGEVAGKTKVTIMDQGLWQAMYEAAVRQGYLLDALASEFVNSTPAPMHGVAAWLRHEAEQRWKICKKIRKKMIKYGAAPVSPAIPAISPAKPQGAMQQIMAGETASLAAASALLSSGCKHIAHIYYDVGKEHDETQEYFGMFPAQAGDALAKFDRQMWCKYAD